LSYAGGFTLRRDDWEALRAEIERGKAGGHIEFVET
jgi:hypothetical protein